MNSNKLRFLGTCACDFSPRLNTDLRDRYDPDARRSSALLVNGHYLIDAGIHISDEFRISGEDPAGVTDLFLTHLHRDHFDPEAVARIAAAKPEPLRVWVRDDAVMPDIPNTEIRRMRAAECYAVNNKAGDELCVTGLSANHDPAAFPQHLIFSLNGKTFFYGCDGAWFLSATWEELTDRHFDMMILDGTCGDYTGDCRIAGHNCIPMIRLLIPSLKTIGAVDEKTAIWISHLAPSLHKPHRETEAILAADGVRVASDGLTVEL